MATQRNGSDAGCGLFCLPFGKKTKNQDEFVAEKDIDADDPNVFEEDYDEMLKQEHAGDEEEDAFQQKPTSEQLEDLYKMTVIDKNRNKVVFKELIQSSQYRRHLVVFIRHFFCGNCYGYVKALSKELRPEKLDKQKLTTNLIIIGCGDPILIPQYVEQTGCPYQIYADPSRSLYRKLGFAATTAPPPQEPQYVSKYSLSFWSNIFRSLKLTAKTGKVSGGPVVQVGGELIWIEGELQHCHRMRNAGDHMEVPELLRLLNRQAAQFNRKEGSVTTRGSRRNSFVRALRRLSSVVSGDRLSLISSGGEDKL